MVPINDGLNFGGKIKTGTFKFNCLMFGSADFVEFFTI